MLLRELVSLVITPMFLLISTTRLLGGAGFTMFALRDSDVFSPCADWLCLS